MHRRRKRSATTSSRENSSHSLFLSHEETKRRNQIVFAKTSIGVTMREGGICKIEESVYGAAIYLPQMARTVGWDKTITTLVLRAWFFLVLNCWLQAYLLTMLSKEENVMDMFSGQMNLCDFGAFVEDCPGPGCMGPAGTEISAARMHTWSTVVNRNFVKDSFHALFPQKAHDIEDAVDVGEYGLQSYWCRFFCCFVFMIPCMEDLVGTYKVCQMLYLVPTEAAPWVALKEGKEIDACCDLSEVRLKIAGMPATWKAINFVTVVLPKIVLWVLTVETGMKFLMETSGIQNIIVNAVGLTFIANLDELFMAVFMSEETQDIVSNVEEFALWDPTTSSVGDITILSDDEIVERYHQLQSWKDATWIDFVYFIPMKLVIAMALTYVFNWLYYESNCTRADAPPHRWISKVMFLPKSTAYAWYQALFPSLFPPDVHEEPFWQMPK